MSEKFRVSTTLVHSEMESQAITETVNYSNANLPIAPQKPTGYQPQPLLNISNNISFQTFTKFPKISSKTFTFFNFPVSRLTGVVKQCYSFIKNGKYITSLFVFECFEPNHQQKTPNFVLKLPEKLYQLEGVRFLGYFDVKLGHISIKKWLLSIKWLLNSFKVLFRAIFENCNEMVVKIQNLFKKL